MQILEQKAKVDSRSIKAPLEPAPFEKSAVCAAVNVIYRAISVTVAGRV